MQQTHAMQHIMQVARKHKNWQLASLAVRVKVESCKKELDETEDKIKEATNVQEDLDSKHKDLTNTLARLAKRIDELKNEVKENEVALKEAGETRKAENQVFQ